MRWGVALLLGLCGVSAQANADWQYTKWGMTRDEVTKASGEKAVADTTGAMASLYDGSGHSFKVTFGFTKESERLAWVSLHLQNPDNCKQVFSNLQEVYGPPHERAAAPPVELLSWEDRKSKNSVALIATYNQDARRYSGCLIRYTPPEGPGRTGGL